MKASSLFETSHEDFNFACSCLKVVFAISLINFKSHELAEFVFSESIRLVYFVAEDANRDLLGQGLQYLLKSFSCFFKSSLVRNVDYEDN